LISFPDKKPIPTMPDITISAAIIANQAKPIAILKPVKM